MSKTLASRILCLLIFSACLPAFAASGNVEQRLNKLENLLGNQVLMEQMQQMDQIRQELTELRELLEAQENQFVMIKQRQRNLYQDMDRRLHDLEEGSVSNVFVPDMTAQTNSNIGLPVDSAKSNKSSIDSVLSVNDKSDKQTYSQIYVTLKEGNYQQAIIDFNQFVKRYPNSSYTDNAYYWLGEAYYLSRNNPKALQAFQKIVNDFPSGNKVKDAKLKIGYTYFAMQDWASAKTALERVIADYPNDKAAVNAKSRLQRMQRENR